MALSALGRHGHHDGGGHGGGGWYGGYGGGYPYPYPYLDPYVYPQTEVVILPDAGVAIETEEEKQARLRAVGLSDMGALGVNVGTLAVVAAVGAALWWFSKRKR